MYKFLVVEDEQYARKSVSATLNELNDGNVFEAENGAAALALIERENIDAVITDIQMPVMDGIELLNTLSRKHERIVTAVLSGYDEFAYVQAAMGCSVIDYVLKPFDRGDIAVLYHKMLRKLQARTSLDREIASLAERSDRIRPFIKQRFFMDLIGGEVDSKQLEEMRTYLGLNLCDRPLRLCLIEVDERESALVNGGEKEKFCLYNVLKIISRIAQEWGYVDTFEVSSNELAVIWCPPDSTREENSLVESAEKLINEMNSVYGIILNISISSIVEGLKRLSYAFDEAGNLLKYRLIYGSSQVFDSTRMGHAGARLGALQDAGQVVEAVWRNAPEQALQILENQVRDIQQNNDKYGVRAVNLYFQKILTDCLIILEHEGGDLSSLDGRLGVNCMEWRASQGSMQDAVTFFRRLLPEISDAISRSRSSERRDVITRAKELIAEQYAETLSVEVLANQLHFSKNYFGQMFRNETGMSVREYVNLLRIQHAKTMILENKLKMYEIAEAIGFSDQQYFTKVFKKIVGCMPTEYQR